METSNDINILLVDDKPENLLALEKLLEGEGLKIFKAESGQRALELLLNHGFALALVDVQMPDMNGFELAELMRGKETTKAIPIIFVTAGAIDAKHTFMGYEAGAVDFLYKPLDMRVVKSKVKIFTELEKNKILIKNQVDRLAEAVRWRDDFISIASHELKTPITSLRLQMQMAQRQTQSDSLDAEKLQRIFYKSDHQLTKLTRLIDDLLDTTKLRAGKLTVEVKPVNLSDLLKDTVDKFSPQLIEADCSVTLDIQNDLMVICDQFRTEQVISNLLSNVAKYAPDENVHVSLKKAGPKVELKIKDSGKGIPTDKIGSIFERFERAHDHTGVSGLGLGLYIVKQIMEAHNGSIRVESEPNQGCTFTVEFPSSP